jgi:hypothetical protein
MTREPYGTWNLILAWFVANFLGVAAIGALSLIPFLTSIRGRFVSSLIIGLPIGFAQWMALRRIAPISGIWVITISAGVLTGIDSPILGMWGFLGDESILGLTAGIATFAFLVGLAQWLFLRGRFARSLVWPLSSAVGLGFGIGLALALDLMNQGLMPIILVTLVYTTVTGLAISWMYAADKMVGGNLVANESGT